MKTFFFVLFAMSFVLIGCDDKIKEKQSIPPVLAIIAQAKDVKTFHPKTTHKVASFSVTNMSNTEMILEKVLLHVSVTDSNQENWSESATIWLQGGTGYVPYIGDGGYVTLSIDDDIYNPNETHQVDVYANTENAKTGDSIQVTLVLAKLTSIDLIYETWQDMLCFAPTLTFQRDADIEVSRSSHSPKGSFIPNPSVEFLNFDISSFGDDPVIIEEMMLTVQGYDGGSGWKFQPLCIQVNDSLGSIGGGYYFVQDAQGNVETIFITCTRKPVLFTGDTLQFSVLIVNNESLFDIGDYVSVTLTGLSCVDLTGHGLSTPQYLVFGHSLTYTGIFSVDVQRALNTPSISTPKTDDIVFVFTLTNHNPTAMDIKDIFLSIITTDIGMTQWNYNNSVTIRNQEGSVWFGPETFNPWFSSYIHFYDDIFIPSGETVVLSVCMDTTNIHPDDTVLVTVGDVWAIDLASGFDVSTNADISGDPVSYNAQPLSVTVHAGTPNGGALTGFTEVLKITVYNPNAFSMSLKQLLFEVHATDHALSGWTEYPNLNKSMFNLYFSSNLNQSIDTQEEDWTMFTSLGSNQQAKTGEVINIVYLDLSSGVNDSVNIPANASVTLVLKMNTSYASSMFDDELRVDVRGAVTDFGRQVLQVIGGTLYY